MTNIKEIRYFRTINYQTKEQRDVQQEVERYNQTDYLDRHSVPSEKIKKRQLTYLESNLVDFLFFRVKFRSR